MKFSKKSRYAIRALICLASSPNERLPLSTIAEKSNISLQYLEQVFASLRRSNIVRSVKGSQGGYILSSSPTALSVAQIVSALEGAYQIEQEPSDDSSSDAINTMIIDKANTLFENLLNSTSLQDLIDYCTEKETDEPMYFI